jgi:ankyrin repeat protein
MKTDGRRLLSWAARNRHKVTVKLLLDTRKVDVNSKDKDGRTPVCEQNLFGGLPFTQALSRMRKNGRHGKGKVLGTSLVSSRFA